MEVNEKVRENRLRRIADRQGLHLYKSPRRDHRAIDYGRYALVDTYGCVDEDGTIYTAAGENTAFRYTLSQVEQLLSEYPAVFEVDAYVCSDNFPRYQNDRYEWDLVCKNCFSDERTRGDFPRQLRLREEQIASLVCTVCYRAVQVVNP